MGGGGEQSERERKGFDRRCWGLYMPILFRCLSEALEDGIPFLKVK